MPGALLESIRHAIVARAMRPMVRYAPLDEVICDVARDAMIEWTRHAPDPRRRRAALEALAQLSEDHEELLAQSVATGPGPYPLREPLTAYLMHIPATVRRSFARFADPAGRTAPPKLAIDESHHLLPFLPLRAPRFQRGQRPLRGVDLELDALLGVGGFGEVWKAHHRRDPAATPVALKFCLEPDAVAVLRHEESILRQFMKRGGCKGLVNLRNAHLAVNPPCLEYEYIEGDDLGRQFRLWAESSPRDARSKSLLLMRDLVAVVAAAHRLDPPVVHRDLKPANILLESTDEGPRVRVTDFGIGGLATRQAATLTQTNPIPNAHLLTRLAGAYTPLYASAEQMKGELPDPRDDVYALGVIWYQLLLGDLSATPTPDWNVILQQRGVRAGVIDLVGRCLASGKRRLPNASHLAQALERLLPPEEQRASKSRIILEEMLDAEALDVLIESAPGSSPVAGTGVLQSPMFRENILSFPCACGLALQGLERAWLRTNLRQAASLFGRLRQTWRGWWKSSGAWGVDVGQCALKAIRLQEIDGQLTATVFDYIEYPKILGRPGAAPEQLIHQALAQFISRNDLHGDTVGVALAGECSPVNIVKLHYIEEKKLADAIASEARQRIPFNLNEAVWDWQRLDQSKVVDGVVRDAEIGLFALKRDRVDHYLQLFKNAGVELQIVQPAPAALCNFVAFDRLDKDAGEKFCVAALDVGAESSNLVITDGFRIFHYQSIPLGGTHFTSALTRDMKLSFARAESLKRNAAKSPTAELNKILTALAPVYDDFAAQVRRALAAFTDAHPDDRIDHLIALGNGSRLPGLQRFLAEELQLDVRKPRRMKRLS